MKKLAFLVVVALVNVVPVRAELHLAGEATISNSWYQAFTLTDTKDPPVPGPGEPGLFDMVGIQMGEGVLEGDGITYPVSTPAVSITKTFHDLLPFPAPAGAVISAYDVIASGANMQALSFTLNFEGSIADPVAFTLVTWDRQGATYQASSWEEAVWSGGPRPRDRSWAITDYSALLVANGGPVDLDFPSPFRSVPVPLPAAVLLGALGLGVAGWRLRQTV